METQNQTQPQVQVQPQGQMQPQQNFDVKQTLSKFDKYSNELLNSILVVLGIVSGIFFIVPLFDLKIMGMPITGFSFAFLASLGSLVQSAQTILGSSSSSSSIANMGATLTAVGFISFSLFLSLAMVLLPLLKQTKKHSGFTFIPALANCIIFLRSIAPYLHSIILLVQALQIPWQAVHHILQSISSVMSTSSYRLPQFSSVPLFCTETMKQRRLLQVWLRL